MRKIIEYIFIFIVGSIVVSLFYYVIFSVFFCTDVEKRLRDENRVFREELPEIEKYSRIAADELEYLRSRDENIYRQVFKADVPQVGKLAEGDIQSAMDAARRVEDNWRAVFEMVNDGKFIAPPLVSPVENLRYQAVGASVGSRMNPFYKVNTYHDGIDIIAPEGTPVLSTADGWVEKVNTSEGGKGKSVEVSHLGGYVTRYAHLSEISVKKGAFVRVGSQIGLVGDSGRSFTTHLHYEVMLDGRTVDPANFFLCSLTPYEYINVLMMSASSGQSMD